MHSILRVLGRVARWPPAWVILLDLLLEYVQSYSLEMPGSKQCDHNR